MNAKVAKRSGDVVDELLILKTESSRLKLSVGVNDS